MIENLGRYFKIGDARAVKKAPENSDSTSTQLFRPLSIASENSHDIRTNEGEAEKIHETFNKVVLEAARGSGLIASEESQEPSKEDIKKLVSIMLIALKNKGIGNPKDDLGEAQELFIKDYRKIYPLEDSTDADENLVKKAKKFSSLFQDKMKIQNVRSGRKRQLFSRNEDEDDIVGARLSRLATPENLMFFLEQYSKQIPGEAEKETSKEKNVKMLVDLASKLGDGGKTKSRVSPRDDNLKFASDEKWKKYAKEKNWKSLETKEDKKTKNTEKVKISDLIKKLHDEEPSKEVG